VSDPFVELRRFPDFLIAGPQRTGTTWLHAQLRFHPQIFLSEPKELFFFSRLQDHASPKFQSDDLVWYLRFFRDPLWRYLLKTGICLWKYRQLYRPIVRGEATASYAALDRDVIAEIAALKPGIKVVLMIRNPIDRAWSHAKKDLVRNHKRRVDEVSPEEFERFFVDPYQLRCAHYAENYDAWCAGVGAENVFVGRFDDVASRPEELLLDVMRFLAVRAERSYIPSDVRAVVNPAGAAAIPERYRRFLEELLAPDLKRLRERFGMSWPSAEPGRPSASR
jgi:Sulfotransferase domain